MRVSLGLKEIVGYALLLLTLGVAWGDIRSGQKQLGEQVKGMQAQMADLSKAVEAHAALPGHPLTLAQMDEQGRQLDRIEGTLGRLNVNVVRAVKENDEPRRPSLFRR